MQLQGYDIKPVVQLAFQLTEDHIVTPDVQLPTRFYITHQTEPGELTITSMDGTPQVGGWIGRRSDKPESATQYYTDGQFRFLNDVW